MVILNIHVAYIGYTSGIITYGKGITMSYTNDCTDLLGFVAESYAFATVSQSIKEMARQFGYKSTATAIVSGLVQDASGKLLAQLSGAIAVWAFTREMPYRPKDFDGDRPSKEMIITIYFVDGEELKYRQDIDGRVNFPDIKRP